MTQRFAIDTSWFRPRNRSLVVAGSPLRMFRLTSQGAVVADALEKRSELPSGHESLTSRMRDAGAIHPLPLTQVGASDITVVIPAFISNAAEAERLDSLVSSLTAHPILVIDDASPLQFQVEGATVVRRSSNGGPAAARNSAMNVISTPYVAFVDIDVVVSSETICTAAAHCSDGAALSSPRVRDASSRYSHGRWIARYEQAKSPLDLGAEPARVKPLTRVSYVPAAVLVMRTESFRRNKGFDESMRTGEDVDLVWRVSAREHCRYEPSVVAYHYSRMRIRNFISQRIGYGASAAPLAKRHGASVAPFSSNIILFLMSLTAAVGVFAASGVFAAIHIAYVGFTLTRNGDDFGHALRVAIRSAVHSLKLFTDALTRTWFFPYVVLALIAPSVRWILVAVLVVPALIEWLRTRCCIPPTYVLLRSVDNFAYCFGVWRGVLAIRSARCLMPSITPLRQRAS